MKWRLLQRRTVWWPTWIGWLGLVGLAAAVGAIWSFGSEDFLSLDRKVPGAEVLVVEGWVGLEAIRASAELFKQGNYDIVVTSGGPDGSRWSEKEENYAEMAGQELARAGVPPERIVVARSDAVERHRTYATALAVKKALDARQLESGGLDVFTIGIHARRSRLVFASVFAGSGAEIGSVAWHDPEDAGRSWWQSSERAKELMTETVGYLYERLLNSGRKAVDDREPLAPPALPITDHSISQ